MRRKGQAAIEFMTTYGWALLVIIISIGALSYFDFLDADRYSSTGCTTGSQIQCSESALNTNGQFIITVRNNYPVDIRINDIQVKDEDGNWVGTMASAGAFEVMSRGQLKNISTVPTPEIQYPEGRKISTDVKISFSRNSGGAAEYDLLGSTTMKVGDFSYP